VTGLPPVQTPAWHVSVCVHAFPSLHAGPLKSEHVPFTAAPAATEHASHGPAAQAVLQQTPSAQKPLAQSEPVAHPVPSAPVPEKSSDEAVDGRGVDEPPATSTTPDPRIVAVW
jgi:hypothetical protein